MHVPAFAMGYPVMAATQRHQICDIGGAAVLVMIDVVHVGPGDGGVAAWECAAAISGGDGPALGGAGQAGVAAQIEGDAETVDHHRVQVGVATQDPGGAIGQWDTAGIDR